MQTQVKQTFEQVIETNKNRIYRICRIYAVTPLEPQDLFQDVIYQIWKSYSKFEGKSSVSTWVYKIALNVCMNSKTKLTRKNDKTIRLEAIRFVSNENTTVSEIEEKKYKALQSCILTLKPENRSIVILFLEGLAYKEISEVTGLTENHVAVKMKRIRKELLKCITPKLK